MNETSFVKMCPVWSIDIFVRFLWIKFQIRNNTPFFSFFVNEIICIKTSRLVHHTPQYMTTWHVYMLCEPSFRGSCIHSMQDLRDIVCDSWCANEQFLLLYCNTLLKEILLFIIPYNTIMTGCVNLGTHIVTSRFKPASLKPKPASCYNVGLEVHAISHR